MKKDEKQELIEKIRTSLIEKHTKELERLEENLKISGLKRITKELIVRAIRDKKELLKNLNK